MTEPTSRFLEVSAEHPIFAGHFPGRPIVPGVMLLERVLAEAADSLRRTRAALRVREAKFFAPLEPGQRAQIDFAFSGTRCTFDIRRESTAVARGVLEWDAGA